MRTSKLDSQLNAQGEHPLTWPNTWKRTKFLERARFRPCSFEQARAKLFSELRKLGARDVVISSNLALRADGFPRSDRGSPADPGVAVYFKLDGRDTVLACDRWERVEHNALAIAHHIGAIRAQERYGVGTVAQAFTAYQALPEHAGQSAVDAIATSFRAELGIAIADKLTRELVDVKFRALAKSRHPDAGGDPHAFAKLVRARDFALEEVDALERTVRT